MKKGSENNFSIKKVIVAAIIFPLAWLLGVHFGLGALIGGIIGGILTFIILKLLDKFEKKK